MRHCFAFALFVLCFLPLQGCGSNSGPATAPPRDELTQFLQDNPDLNIVDDEEEEEE